MDFKKFIGGGYASPSVERFDVSVEKGFAISQFNDSIGGGLGEDDTVDLQ